MNRLLSVGLAILFIAGTLAVPLNISAQTAPYNVSFAGDWTCSSDAKNNANTMKTKNVELLQGLGDYSYNTDQQCWIDIVKGLNVKILRGNHDSSEDGSDSSWTQLKNAFSGTTNPELKNGNFYPYTFKNLYTIVLDTQVPLGSGSQMAFLSAELEKAKQKKAAGEIDYVAIASHKMYMNCAVAADLSVADSCGDHAVTEVSGYKNIINLIYKYADVVDLVAQGHDHNWQLSKPLKMENGKLVATTNKDPNAVVWGVFGNLGRSLDSLPNVSTKPLWQGLNGNTKGSTILTLDPAGKKIDLKMYSTSGSEAFSSTLVDRTDAPPPPPNPKAVLTAPTSVAAGQTVTLDGSKSTDYDTLEFKQTLGETVTLANAGVGKKSFIAPTSTESNFQLSFQLIASKGGAQSIAQANIQVFTVPPPPPEICGDGIDNDGDGKIDEDCEPPPAEICGDGVDNDGDGKVDEDCEPEEICGDGIDNNGNGQVDEGCSQEICDDGIDNDGDGKVDEDCPEPPKEICGDGIDNDNDGLVDENCPPPTEPQTGKLQPISITASKEDSGKEAKFVNDWNLETWWEASGIPQSITFKFNATYPINHMKIAGYIPSSTYKFELGGKEFTHKPVAGKVTLYDLKDLGLKTDTITLKGLGNDKTTQNAYGEIHFYTGKVLSEICGNNIDDDKDGLIDEDCPAEICYDEVDNNGNGLIDENCDDPTQNLAYNITTEKIHALIPFDFKSDKAQIVVLPTKNNATVYVLENNTKILPPPPPPEPVAEICGDNIDNDLDGFIDEGCIDPPAELCDDGIDNDGDGKIDEDCQTPLTNQTNLIINGPVTLKTGQIVIQANQTTVLSNSTSQ